MKAEFVGQEKHRLLSYEAKNAWNAVNEEENYRLYAFCEGYKEFLNKAKTEREFVSVVKDMAIDNGYTFLTDNDKKDATLAPGDKIYYIYKDKTIMLAHIGCETPDKGLNIIGSHIDSPRIDFKQNPLYEDTGMVLGKTHYYGLIKKYQWLAIPLAIHGVIVKSNGEAVNVIIGEDDTDPVFTITDLLPHLAQEQMQEKMSDAVQAEDMNLLFGSIPYGDDQMEEKVKLSVLKLLYEKYGMVEEDFQSSELEIVPSFKARDVGIDKSLIGAYGQDDKICAYTSLKALLDIESIPNKTAVCVFMDKEEIGSTGNTGAQSKLLEYFITDICELLSVNVRRCIRNSNMLSADVSGAVDPNYSELHDKKNATYISRGITLIKYTGQKGKLEASDANAEFVGKIRKLFNENNIVWQSGELSKADHGGGGTIAKYAANLGIDVMDCGLPLLSMHSPFEVSGKIDIFMAYKAYGAFFKYIS